MDAKDIRNLSEAYISVYQPQEINEEVEIASEYFYEMGINEYGIDILIEELGVEEFVEWVDEIVEESYLEEADQTRLQKMADKKGKILVGPKGSRPQSSTKAAIKKYGGTVRGGVSGGVSGVIKKRAGAVKTAQDTQPASSSTPAQTKTGIAGRLGAALGAVVKRGREDIKRVQDAAQTARDVAARRGAEVKAVYDVAREKGRAAEQSPQATRARRVAKVAAGRAVQAAAPVAKKAAMAAAGAAGAGAGSLKAGKSPAAAAGRAAGTFVRKMRAEDYILSHLLDEGYAKTPEAAEVIMVNMSEDWRNSILQEIDD